MASTADNLMMSAKAFAMSCETLHATGDEKHRLTILLLSTTSLELSLKAWIKWRGGTEADLRSIGHDLVKAYTEAGRLGFSDANGQLGRAAELLNPINSRAVARYVPDEPDFMALTPASLVDICRTVALTVEGDLWPPRTEVYEGE